MYSRYQETTLTLVVRVRHSSERQGKLMATLAITKAHRGAAMPREPTTAIAKTTFADTRVTKTSRSPTGNIQIVDLDAKPVECGTKCADIDGVLENTLEILSDLSVDEQEVRRHGATLPARSTTCTTWRPERNTLASG